MYRLEMRYLSLTWIFSMISPIYQTINPIFHNTFYTTKCIYRSNYERKYPLQPLKWGFFYTFFGTFLINDPLLKRHQYFYLRCQSDNLFTTGLLSLWLFHPERIN